MSKNLEEPWEGFDARFFTYVGMRLDMAREGGFKSFTVYPRDLFSKRMQPSGFRYIVKKLSKRLVEEDERIRDVDVKDSHYIRIWIKE